MIPRNRGLWALTVLTAVAACAGPADAPPRPGVAPLPTLVGSARIESNGGNYRVEFAAQPQPIPLNESFDLEVRIFDGARPDAGTTSAAAALSPDVALTVDAAMPAHRHGMNVKPEVRELRPGVFVAEGLLFHMPGHWELYFDISRGGLTERAQVDVELE